MIQVILLIVGIFYFVKRPKLKRLAATEFPSVPADRFEEWRQLELGSIAIFFRRGGGRPRARLLRESEKFILMKSDSDGLRLNS